MYRLAIALLLGTTTHSSAAGDLKWPDPELRVPPLVKSFILRECKMAEGNPVESVNECIIAEQYGYRAVVAMLTDEETGELAAVKYRACRAGLGAIGGRFHRNKADCISAPLDIAWRYEFSREASLEDRVIVQMEVKTFTHPFQR